MARVTEILGLKIPVSFKLENQLPAKYQCTAEGSFSDIMNWLEKKPLADEKQRNGNFFNEQVYAKNNNEWRGGSFAELIQPHTDFKNYDEALKKLSTAKIWEKAIQSFAEVTVRRRTRCQYDGEFDYDKRWDIEPFQRRSAKVQTRRVIKVCVKFAFSYGVDASSIEQFGAFVAAIVNLLETNGIMVGVDMSFVSKDHVDGDNSIFEGIVNVKKPDEYLPPGQLLKAMSPNFFRRAEFGIAIAAAQAMGKTACSNLGSPYEFNKQWESKDDTLTIYCAPHPDEQEKIIKNLIEMIGVNSKPTEPTKPTKPSKPGKFDFPSPAEITDWTGAFKREPLSSKWDYERKP